MRVAGGPAGKESVATSVFRSVGQPRDRKAGGDDVPVVAQPFRQDARLAGHDGVLVAVRADGAQTRAAGDLSPSSIDSVRVKMPLAGVTTTRNSTVCSPCPCWGRL